MAELSSTETEFVGMLQYPQDVRADKVKLVSASAVCFRVLSDM